MSDNISNLAVGLVLLDVQSDARLFLMDEAVAVELDEPVDEQTEKQLLSWGWTNAGNLSWGYSHDDG